MELKTLIKERRTVQLFEDRPIPVELIQDLLDTAIWVPNHKMTEPWRFVFVHGDGKQKLAETARNLAGGRERDPEKRAEMGRNTYEKMMSVPAFLAVVMKENPNPAVREEDYASVSCIAHNIGLLAWEQGIGMVWQTYGYIFMPEFREMLGVQPGEKIVGVLHMGYPAKVPTPRPRTPASELLTVIG